jgi:hypothetical protein
LKDDEEVANFVKRMNKGTDGRYRGKPPLICFICDGIGHFANKCPHKKKRNDEGYSKGKQTYKGKITTKKVFKKSLCTKEYTNHQMKMKSVTVRQEEFYSWQYKTLIKKTLNNNMKKPKKNMKNLKNKLKRRKLTTEKN